ncbi:MAG: hypothetical protein JW395_1645 [Nitrospira sp.]|nr:hypothetical protein [Nitrospira sp.]
MAKPIHESLKGTLRAELLPVEQLRAQFEANNVAEDFRQG